MYSFWMESQLRWEESCLKLKFIYSSQEFQSFRFRGNYSFLNLEIVVNSICLNILIFHSMNYIFAAETIQGRKLYEEIW